MTDTDEQQPSSSPIARDEFSAEFNSAINLPTDAVLRASSTVQITNVYKHTVAWVLDTFRFADGREKVFVQQINSHGGQRLLFPPEITRVLARHRDQLSMAAKRRHGRNIMAMRKQRGDVLGNPEALRRARKARKAR